MKTNTHLVIAGLALLAATHPALAQYVCGKPGLSLEIDKSTAQLPPYPALAMRTGKAGTTILSVAIGPDGVPVRGTVTNSSGNAELDAAAVVRVTTDWRWQPPLQYCKPTTADAIVIVGWHLGPIPKPDVAITAAEKAYPPGAIDRLEQGDTYLNLTLGDGGVVKETHIAFSSNYLDLDDRAIAVMKDPSTRIAGKPAGHLMVLLRWKLPARMNVAKAVDVTGMPNNGETQVTER